MKTIYLIQFLSALIFSLFVANISDASEEDTQAIYRHITTLKPSIDKNFANRLAVLIQKYSKKYNLNPNISVAVAMQETSLENKHRTQQVYVLEKGYYKIVEGITDVSLFQFHIKTIQYYKLDATKLANNLEYAVASHFRIMDDKVKLCSDLGKDAWACYHSKTKVHRELYKKLVSRYIINEKNSKETTNDSGRVGFASVQNN